MAEAQNKVFLLAILVICVITAVVLFQPTVREQLAPEPVAAWVAIEVTDPLASTVASTAEGGADPSVATLANVGPVALEIGQSFKLHAVLEAQDRRGEPVYYTEAPRLAFFGEEVPADRLRVWQRERPVKVRWFTVEGERPYVVLDASNGIQGFSLREFLRSDWPVAWTIAGDIDAANDNHLQTNSALKVQTFGTQRYHARIEIYQREEQLIPQLTLRSWGVADLKREISRFPTVEMSLPGPLAPTSKVFGLTLLEPPSDVSEELLAQVEELADHRIAFTLLSALRDQVRQGDKTFGGLEWKSVDLSGETAWDSLQAGDLLRVGDRVVVLYEDRGQEGFLDYGDLCFDFVQGASVRALNEVFSGEGQDIEWASLASGA